MIHLVLVRLVLTLSFLTPHQIHKKKKKGFYTEHPMLCPGLSTREQCWEEANYK